MNPPPFPISNDSSPGDLGDQLRCLRRDPEGHPDASIVIPVNAKADLQTVRTVLGDIARYKGKYAIETILVINNYPPEQPPTAALEAFRSLGVEVVATPSARRPGEVVIISARALGVQAANSEAIIHFDADCRIPDSNALLDWYIRSIRGGAHLAYSNVGFYGLPTKKATRVRLAIHYTVRWGKRTLLRIPTTRGSNYATQRAAFLRCYDAGLLSVDIQVGPALKMQGGRVLYSGDPRLRVLTSGRKQSGRWLRIFPYFSYRLYYNIKAIPVHLRNRRRSDWKGYDVENERRQERDMTPETGKPADGKRVKVFGLGREPEK